MSIVVIIIIIILAVWIGIALGNMDGNQPMHPSARDEDEIDWMDEL